MVVNHKPTCNEVFYLLSPVNNKIVSASTEEVVSSKPPNMVLGKSGSWAIWTRKDCSMRRNFLGNHFIKVKLAGHKLPANLPPYLIMSSRQRHE